MALAVEVLPLLSLMNEACSVVARYQHEARRTRRKKVEKDANFASCCWFISKPRKLQRRATAATTLLLRRLRERSYSQWRDHSASTHTHMRDHPSIRAETTTDNQQ